jgi:hypothetical protein
MKLTVERISTGIWHVIRHVPLDPRWHNMGQLVDHLRARKFEDVADGIEQQMAKHDGVTRSCFIIAYFDFMRDSRIVAMLENAREDNRKDRFEGISKRRKTGRRLKRVTRSKKRS